LVELEFTNAVELRVFQKEWTPVEARSVLEEFVQDMRTGTLRIEALPDEVFVLARRLARRHTAKAGTRSLDILHVASAILLRPDIFYSFDERQRKLAAAEGLIVRPARIHRRATTPG
jgi:predicted nucleic acid-binding protein